MDPRSAAFFMSIALGLSAGALYSLRLLAGAFLWTSRIADIPADLLFSLLSGCGFLFVCLWGEGFRMWWLAGSAGGAYLWYLLAGKRISLYAMRIHLKKKRKKHLTIQQ